MECSLTRLAEVRLVGRPLLVLDGAQRELAELRRGRIFAVVDEQLRRHVARADGGGRGRRLGCGWVRGRRREEHPLTLGTATAVRFSRAQTQFSHSPATGTRCLDFAAEYFQRLWKWKFLTRLELAGVSSCVIKLIWAQEQLDRKLGDLKATWNITEFAKGLVAQFAIFAIIIFFFGLIKSW